MPDAPELMLLVEPDPALRGLVAEYLRTRGLDVRAVGSLDAARAALTASPVQAVLINELLPDGPWSDLLPALRSARRPPAVLVASANPSVEAAVAAMKSGAQDYLVKPLKLRDLHAAIGRAVGLASRRGAQVEGVLGLADSFQAAPLSAVRTLLVELSQALVAETGALGALIAVREPELRAWVELHRANSRVFTHLNLPALGAAVEADAPSPHALPELWHGHPGPLLHLVGLRLRTQPRQPARREGLLALALATEPDEALRVTLRLYGAVTEQAISTSALALRAGRTEQAEPPGPSLAERVRATIEPAMDALLLSEPERARVREALEALAGRGAQTPSPELAAVLAAVNERHDGRGSPQGLSGRRIPPPAALLSLGVWWTLSSGGSALLPPLRPEEVRAELEARAGRQFSPALVAAFLRTLSPDLRSEDTIPPLDPSDDDDESTPTSGAWVTDR